MRVPVLIDFFIIVFVHHSFINQGESFERHLFAVEQRLALTATSSGPKKIAGIPLSKISVARGWRMMTEQTQSRWLQGARTDLTSTLVLPSVDVRTLAFASQVFVPDVSQGGWGLYVAPPDCAPTLPDPGCSGLCWVTFSETVAKIRKTKKGHF